MNKKNICVGAGLVALDVILNGKPETPAKLNAGGSCGNVLSILSYLGWSTFPIARLANNVATSEVEKDLKRWHVKTDLISKTADGSTPIIIHRILKDKSGKPKHKFEFRDPDTSKWLPGYKPILQKEISSINTKLPLSKVFYFDRSSRGTIELAKINKQQGALIFFEPSSIGSDDRLFKESLQVADILKFSHERINNYSELFPKSQVPLEIETRGKEGLKYRINKNKTDETWHFINAYRVSNMVDSAGAGDWCSAGIIHQLLKKSIRPIVKYSHKEIRTSLHYGQVLGALNCYFDGARGIMYNLSKFKFNKIVKTALKKNNIDLSGTNFKKQPSNKKGKQLLISSLYS